jgi:hypothetical protein
MRAQPKPGGRSPSLHGCSSSHKGTAQVCEGAAQATRAQPVQVCEGAAQATRVEPQTTRAQPKPRGHSPSLRGRSPSHEGSAHLSLQGCSPSHSFSRIAKIRLNVVVIIDLLLPLVATPTAERRAHEGPSAALALAWTFALPNASPSPQPPPPSLFLRSRQRQVSPPLNACITEPARRMQSPPWRWRLVKQQRWCSDIDYGSGDWQGGGTAAFVVVQQQSAGRESAALAVVLVTSQRQWQCWQWVWRAGIGT